MTMNRTVITSGTLANKAILYQNSTSVKSVVLCLFDTPQTGTDLNLLEQVLFVSRLKNSSDNPNRAVLALQLQPGQGGYYQNTLGPAFDYIAATFPGLPIDVLSYGNGGTNFAALIETYATKMRSVAIFDSALAPTTAGKAAIMKMYSYISSMQGANSTVETNTTNLISYIMNTIATNLGLTQSQVWQSDGSSNKQLKCWSSYRGPLIDTFVPGNGLQGGVDNYWGWLEGIVDLDPAHLFATPTKNIYVNGIKVGPWTGDPIVKVEMY